MKRWLLGITLFGIIISLYAIPLHYGADSICNISDNFNCDKVNQSVYSELFGIPVALLGLLAYLTVFLLVLKQKTIQHALAFTNKDFLQYLFFFTIVMLLFQGYLTATEIFFIHAYCLVCLLSQVCTLALASIVGKLYSRA